MKLNKIAGLTALALSFGIFLTTPLPARALMPDETTAATLEQENEGYLILDTDELDLEIPTGMGYTTGYIGVLYVEDPYSTITWSSSNTSVATVSSNGTVTGWSSGSAIITARTNTGSVGRCLVTVSNEKRSRLNTSYLYMDIEYNNLQPRAQLYLKDASVYDGVYQWRSSNSSVATVDRNGVVTAYQEGVATIYASTYRGDTLSCTVTVQNNVGRVTLSENRVYLENIGGQAALTAKVAVADPSSVRITWVSSNPAAVTVDANGIVTAVGQGEATITATASTGRSDSCKVYTGSLATQKKQEADSFLGLGGLLMDLFD